MTRKSLVLLAGAGSAALMLGALGFQYLGEMPPCKMCYWQRYGHVLAIVMAVIALAWRPLGLLIWTGAAGALGSSLIGIYHSGVERDWWEGPTSCTSQSIEGLSAEELTRQIMEAPLVRCDEIPWELFGLSMANYNVFVSAALAAVWIAAGLRRA